jgi:energy-coupling factor transporter ATP-binding protein EcfA2
MVVGVDQTGTAGASIQASGLHKAFGSGAARIVAVHDVSMTIEPGAVVALCGPSGSGKSTLLHLIAGIEPTSASSPWPVSSSAWPTGAGCWSIVGEWVWCSSASISCPPCQPWTTSSRR